MIENGLKNRCAMGAIAAALAVAAAPAAAQVEQEQAGTSDTAGVDREPDGTVDAREIVVTGSLIRGTPEDAALPVDVFDSAELERAALDSPLEFIKELPSVGPVLGDSNQFSTASQGFQGTGSINLRSLGPQRTLVLLNGKRTIQSPGDGFSDTNLIPLFALERVELLKDGAAATYGSDAIAGVANFITRDRFEGVELDGDYTFIDGSDGNFELSALFGTRLGDRASLVAGIGWQRRTELPTTARDFANPPFPVNPSAFSALATPGLFAVTYLGASGLNTQVRPDRGCNELGGFQDGTLCRFTFVPFDNLVEDEDRYQGYASLTVDLTEDLEFFVNALYARTDLESLNYSPSFPPIQGPRGTGFQSAFTTSPANPGLPAFLNQVGLPPSGGSLGTIVAVTNVLYRPLGFLGNPRDPERGAGEGRVALEGYRLSGGFEIAVGSDYTANIDATFWGVEREATVDDIVGTRLQNALNGLGGFGCDPRTGRPGVAPCQFLNPFVNAGPENPTLDIPNPFFVPGNQNDPELIRFIQQPNGTVQREDQLILDAVFTGPLGLTVPGGDVQFAVGAQYRKNNFSSRPANALSDLTLNPCFREGDFSCVGTVSEGVGPFIFLGGTRRVKLDQDVYALFGEVNVPLFDRLELAGAVRFEDYGQPIGSTINPKASARFELTDFLTLRGSVGTTFRGPLASDVAPNAVTALLGFTAAAGNFKANDIFGNPNDLEPETALTYNIGAILDTGGLTVSVDFFSIDFKDRITLTPANAIASLVGNFQTTGNAPVNCASPLASLITFNNNQCVQGVTRGIDIARVRSDIVNGPDVLVRGLDFAANFARELGPGTASIGGNATLMLDYRFDDFELNGVTVQPGYDAVGFGNFFRDPGSVPEWRATGYVNYNFSGVNLRYGVSYIDGVFDDRCIDRDPCFQTSQGGTNFGVEAESFTQHDFLVSYDFVAGGADVQLQGGVKNFTDADPAPAQLPSAYNPFIGNPLGRNYRLGLRVRF